MSKILQQLLEEISSHYGQLALQKIVKKENYGERYRDYASPAKHGQRAPITKKDFQECCNLNPLVFWQSTKQHYGIKTLP